MPRPGPRPYECVRRSWHSDRHKPMRGSIIQQIFRVVHENHSSNTKKNREWQEKLPLVVLKAEEIMYSKANSEAEYSDPGTLWDRVNDAVDTIIRKDESVETGEFLPPCVEAALNLGCVPVRASRSERNSNPRSYLSPRAQDSGSNPTKILDSKINGGSTNSPSGIETLNPVSKAKSVPEANRHVRPECKTSNLASCTYKPSFEKFPLPVVNRFDSLESNSSFGVASVYPLYFHPDTFQTPQSLNNILVGTPVFQGNADPSPKGCLRNLFSCEGGDSASNVVNPLDGKGEKEKAEAVECDLSLRLGPHNPLGEGKFDNVSRPQSKEFPFFPMATGNDPLNCCRSGINFEREVEIVEASHRKRKVPANVDVKDGSFFWQLESTSSQNPDRMKRQVM